MNILISGGTGFIGKALVKSLTGDNHFVYILSRHPEAHLSLSDKNTTILKWDGKTPDGWGNVIEKIDAVINLAGENIAGNSFASIFFKRLTPARKNLLLESRLNSAKALIQAIDNASHKPSVFIQASAVGYYGDRGNEILTEVASPGKDFTAQLCIQWENGVSKINELNIRCVIIRTAGMVLSLSGGAFPYMLLPYRFFMGGPLGSGDQWVSWIHIDDEVRAIRFLLENDSAVGNFNLSAPQPVTNRDFSIAIGKTIHRPSWLPLPVPLFSGLLGDKAKILLASQRQIPEKLDQMGFNFSYPNIDCALQNLL
jgi:uncharacterized protein